MSKRQRRKASSVSGRVLGEFIFFENGKRQVVQVCNKREMHNKLMELDAKPWIGNYRYQQLR